MTFGVCMLIMISVAFSLVVSHFPLLSLCFDVGFFIQGGQILYDL